MTVLQMNNNRAIDFKHVRSVETTLVMNGQYVSVTYANGDVVKLFNVEGHKDDEIAMLITRVCAACMTNASDHLVVLEDVIIKEWHYAMYPHKGEKS